MSLKKVVLMSLMSVALHGQAQTTLATPGTVVFVSATGKVTHPNNEATVSFLVVEQDKDKRAAAARVNQKMKEGMEILRREAPQAALKSTGYSSYEIFADRGSSLSVRTSLGWRVEQELRLKTTDLASLPKLTSAAQKVLGVSEITFGLTEDTVKSQDELRIGATYRNLNERVASIAAAMGRKVSDAVVETLDFEGATTTSGPMQMVEVTGSRIRRSDRDPVDPSFEPGETTLTMRLVGKVKFK